MHTNVRNAGNSDSLSSSINYGVVCKTVESFSERTAYRSIEALAGGIARTVVMECGADRVTVRIEKPRALLHAACAGVEISRTRRDVEVIDAVSTGNSGRVDDATSTLDVAGEDLM
jgi:dihydroneopterin aldolase / 2-amino-4-hydroxy-6-hydroxymethyldihydropteridine diphosphokinase / dihydropteroate synthase